MYSRNQLVSALKSLASVDDSLPDKSYNQLLNYHAQRLQFQSYEHFRRYVNSAPSVALGNLSTKLMERVCASKLPSFNEPYYEFTPFPGGLGYYSHWIGWDKNGNEVRVPRPLDAQHSVPAVRKLLKKTIYVIENKSEILPWQYLWRAPAYISHSIATEFYPRFFSQEHLVDPDVPRKLVQLRIAENFANLSKSIDEVNYS
jgi:hypothetical protein